MAGNARFHDKLHRKNHHSNPTTGFADSATDPIASREEPFQGDFVINGLLSSSLGIDILSANIHGNLECENIIVRDTTYTNFISGQGTETIISDGALTGYGDFSCTIDFQNGIYLNTPSTYMTGDSYVTKQLSAGSVKVFSDASVQNDLYIGRSTTMFVDLSVHNNATVDGNLLIRGNLSALGDVSVIETNLVSTSAVGITNHSPFDPALKVHQYGSLSTIASFSYEADDDIVVINPNGLVINKGNLQVVTGDVLVGGLVVAPNITNLQNASGYWNSSIQALTSTSGYWNTSIQTLTATSAYWDAAFQALTSTSAYWNSVYSTVSTISGDLVRKSEDSFTALTGTSANWDTAYFVLTTMQQNITGNWDTTFTTVSVNSGDWDSTKSTVNTKKDFWNNTYNTVAGLSAGWDNAVTKFTQMSSGITEVNNTSGYWNSSIQALTSTSAYWDVSIQTLTATSAYWDASIQALTSTSGYWNTAIQTLTATSAYWDAAFQILSSTSGYWNTAIQTLTATSAYWDASIQALTATSGYWNSSIQALTSTSAYWDASIQTLTSTSGYWNTAIQTLTATSAYWDTAYNSITATSGKWLSGSEDLNFVCGNINVLSSLSANTIHVFNAIHVSVSSFTTAPGTISMSVNTPSYLFANVNAAGTLNLNLPEPSGKNIGIMFYIKNVSTAGNRIVVINNSVGTPIAFGSSLAGNANAYSEVVWDGTTWQTTVHG